MRNSYGFVPFGGVTHNRPDQMGHLKTVDTTASFSPKADYDPASFAAFHGTSRTNLVELASCVTLDDNVPSVAQRLFDFATASGPLFGDFGEELLRDWAYAANNANLVVGIQSCLRQGGIQGFNRSKRVLKSFLASDDGTPGEHAVDVLHARLYASGPYEQMLGNCHMTWAAISGRTFWYTFMVRAGYVGRLSSIDAYAVSMHEPLTPRRYGVLCDHFLLPSGTTPKDAEEVGQDLLSRTYEPLLESEHPEKDVVTFIESCGTGHTKKDREANNEVNFASEVLDEGDANLLALMTKVIVEAHYYNARVSVFNGASDAGYIRFNNALEWLWFDYARVMARTEIAYCQQCGKAFSISGHRGMKRLYCCDSCRTAAKNERARSDTQRTRQLFRQGSSVEEIACEVYNGSRTDEATVRTKLSTWTSLKNELEQSIEEDGWDGSLLLRRCENEGLDLRRLLRSKRLQEFDRRKSSHVTSPDPLV